MADASKPTITVYEEGSDDDPFEKLFLTYIDWMDEIRKVIDTLDKTEIGRCLKKLKDHGDSRAAEIIRLEIETHMMIDAVIAKMETTGAQQWCIYHDCDSTKCPPKSHFWCDVHDCADDECPNDECAQTTALVMDPPSN